jgi:hypothetical protein
MLARRWFTPRWLALCAVLLVVWPHSVTMPAYLLSETLVGFLTAAGLLFLGEGFVRRQVRWLVWGAACFGLAGLTNAVIAPFLPALAIASWCARPRQWRTFALIFLISVAPPAFWAGRNALFVPGPTTSSRAIINLVQGSWPEYHDAWQASLQGNPTGKATGARIDGEVRAAVRAPWAGMSRIAARIHSEPLRYIAWYASKPALLWGWDMRIAAAPLYVFPTRNSALESNELMRGLVLGLKLLNPWIGLLALVGCGVALAGTSVRHASTGALALLYVSLIYGVFQAEPRYGVPFRGDQIVMATLALAWMTTRLKLAFQQRGTL